MEGEKGTKNETTDIIKHKPYIQAGHGINLQLYDINNCRFVQSQRALGNGKWKSALEAQLWMVGPFPFWAWPTFDNRTHAFPRRYNHKGP